MGCKNSPKVFLAVSTDLFFFGFHWTRVRKVIWSNGQDVSIPCLLFCQLCSIDCGSIWIGLCISDNIKTHRSPIKNPNPLSGKKMWLLPTLMVLVLLSLHSVVLDAQEGCCQNQVWVLDQILSLTFHSNKS